jgi:hypothetical protein
MRFRTALAITTAMLAAAGSMTPALAGPTGGVVKGSWTFTATPNPTGDAPAPAGKGKCDPAGGVGRATQEFTVPGPGSLEGALNNQLDWSGDIRTKADGEVLADADGSGTPMDPEAMTATFKKKTVVIVGACNLEGEPSITATYTFTPKKKR